MSSTPFSPVKRSDTTKGKVSCILEDTQRALCEDKRLSFIESALLGRLHVGEASELKRCWVTMVKGILEERERRMKGGGNRNEE